MSILTICTYPDEVLSKKAEPITEFDDELQRLIDDMVETMYDAPGVGLAAPQVGVSKRLIVLDPSVMEGVEAELVVLINPEIVKAEGSISFDEGCLSLPGFTTTVNRASDIIVKGLDRDGKEITIEAGDFPAIVYQHEIDHLEGVVLLDRASFLKREFYKKKIKKQLSKVS